jgi:prephenate dehydratase
VTETASSGAPTIGYLGPRGTFTEQALLTQTDLAAMDHRLIDTIADVVFATHEGSIDMGFVPIENAIEGSVNVTVDTLAFDTDLLIQREVIIPVVMNVLVRPGTSLDSVTTVLSHPVADAQCRTWLRANLPDVYMEAARSTAEAVRILAEDRDDATAAIGTALAAEVYDLEIAATDIEDHPENSTRFVAVARRGVPVATGHDKTSIVIFQRTDRPGSLLAILQEFAARSINLTKLESRPTKQTLGDYCFLIDFEGHVADELVGDCLKNIVAKHGHVKFLGSYPAAGADAHEARADADEAWSDAETWLAELRSHLG